MPVVAAVRTVPDSPWYLVAKIDLDEINRPLYERLLLMSGLIGALLLGSGAIIGFIWRNQRAQFYRFRYLAARAAEDSEKRLMIIFESSKDGIMVADIETKRFIVANQASSEMLGYSHKELLAMSVQDIHPVEKLPAIVEKFEQQALGKISVAADVPIKRKDGSVFYADINTTPIVFGERDCLLGTMRDITDRMQSEARIEHLNRVLRAIRNINQLIVRADSAGQMIASACSLLVDHGSYTSAMVILTDSEGRPASHTEAGMGRNFPLLVEQLERGEMPPCCQAADTGNGVCVIKGHGNVCKGCINIDSCVSPQKMSICLRHQDTLYGYLVVSLGLDIAMDAEEDKLLVELAGDLAYSLHNIEVKKAGQIAEKERKNLQNQLIQAQKMESVGRLAGGVAHDYNNMLSVIVGYSEMALQKLDPTDQLYEDLQEIHTAALRSTEITRQLLAFARKQTIAPVALDLNEAVEGMLKMLRRLIGEDIDLAWMAETGLWPVKMDPSQVDQVLANLCVNARDAIDGVGRITIETDKAIFDEAYCADHPGFIPGEYVLLAVSDDGCGMDHETVNKIFEPFFTTKEVGQGTGLGLSTVYGIVKQNNGFINVYSEPGKGTTFKIYLARHTDLAHMEPREKPVGVPLGQGETILVVEDEASILKLAKRILEELRYTVMTAENPSQALHLAEGRPNEIDLLITDVVMPEMNGKELSYRLRELYPGLKTLFMSGYTANVIVHRGVLDEGVNFIQKPFSSESMARKVREALDK
jgi:PAS domain S-box-containing protein